MFWKLLPNEPFLASCPHIYVFQKCRPKKINPSLNAQAAWNTTPYGLVNNYIHFTEFRCLLIHTSQRWGKHCHYMYVNWLHFTHVCCLRIKSTKTLAYLPLLYERSSFVTCITSFMTAFPRTFGMAIACNLKLLVRLRLYLSGFLHILHSMLPTMQGSLKSINIYIYIKKNLLSAFQSEKLSNVGQGY